MELNNKTMPTHIATMIEGCHDIILVTRGQSGWQPLPQGGSLTDADRWVAHKFGARTPTAEERKQALWSAIFGWSQKPGPAIYPVD